MDEVTEIEYPEENPYLKSLKAFFIEMPLYDVIQINDLNSTSLYYLITNHSDFDAYCTSCEKDSVFKRKDNPSWATYEWNFNRDQKSPFFIRILYKCVRNDDHLYESRFLLQDNKLQKIGQWPSIANFQYPLLEKYKQVLGGEKYKELNRAVGLASHSVGIGSFVYLRRIFENLIEEAHSKAKSDSNFIEQDYIKSRMNEKILLLKDHLPEFLVENSSMYSILSKGIHELSENECLDYFEPLKVAIELILDEKIEEKRKQEKIAASKKALADIKNKIK